MQQYGACVIDWELRASYTTVYYVYNPSQSCLLCHPYIPHSILQIIILLQAAKKDYV